MIGKIFRFESRRMWKLCVALLILCVLGVLGFALAAIGGRDARTADCAELAFSFLNGMSYAGPLALLLAVLVGERLSHYRMAGVKDSDAAAGRQLAVLVWVTVFMVGEILLATLFDALFFLNRTVVRNQVLQSAFLLSLRSHGGLRLLFAPSVGGTMTLLYFVYDLLRVTFKKPKRILSKLVLTAVLLVLISFIFLVLMVLWEASLAFHPSFYGAPDSVLPLNDATRIFVPEGDVVKDYHLFAVPITNLVFLPLATLFVVAGHFYLKLLGRCRNEIQK